VRILKARYRSKAEFLEQFQPTFAFGGLFFPTREIVALGEAVVVEVSFPGLTERMLVRGFVSFRRGGRHRTGTRAGIGIEFLASERLKRDFLVAMARDEVARDVAPRRHRRLPVAIAVDFRITEQRERTVAVLGDIGPGGAFIKTREVHPTGTTLVLSVVPPGSAAPLLIEGRVAWSTGAPGEEGLGVEFRCRDTGGLRRLKELVRRLETAD
jgi:Tfp pilus assembly protein PilZ